MNWIAFAFKAPPPNDTIIAIWDEGELLLRETFSSNYVGENGLDPNAPARFRHVAVFTTAEAGIGGVRLFKDEGRGQELSRVEYDDIRYGWWMQLTDFIRQCGIPTPENVIVNGTPEQNSLILSDFAA